MIISIIVIIKRNPDSSDWGNILQAWKERTLTGDDCRLIINRDDFVNSFEYVIKKLNFSFTKTPKIEFFGEEAVDGGGPCREFFS
jgi:hypothetical protein